MSPRLPDAGQTLDTNMSGAGTLDLWRFSGAMLRWSWLLVALAVVAGGIAYYVSGRMPFQYEAEARVLVGSLTATDLQEQLAYQQLAQTYAVVATTTPIMERVVDRLGLTDDPQTLAAQLAVRAPSSLSVVDVTATATTPELAAALANAVAEQVTELARDPDGTGLASVIEPASLPGSPSSPRVLFNTVIAAGLGLAIGVGVVLIITARKGSRRSRGPE